MFNEHEIWRPVVGFEGTYSVSNMGRVRRELSKAKHNKGGYRICPERILVPIHNRGYHSIMLSVNNVQKVLRIHRLVAFSFLPIIEGKPYVNHINGIRNDNRLSNLEWCNNSENQKHAYEKLNKQSPRNRLGQTGKLCKTSKPVIQLTMQGALIKEWDAISDACRELGYSQAFISRSCIKGCAAYDFHWKFKKVT